MSRRRRTVRVLSSPMSASAMGLTSIGPMVCAHALGDAELRIGRLLQEHRQVPHHGPSTSLVTPALADTLNGEASSSRLRPPPRPIVRRARGRRRAPADRCSKRRVEHTRPRIRPSLDLEEVEDQVLVERAHLFVAHGREPGADPDGWVVADLFDLDRLRLRRGQLARVSIGHEFCVRIRHQHFGRGRPHAFKLRIVLEHRRRLFRGGRQDVLLLGGIGTRVWNAVARR